MVHLLLAYSRQEESYLVSFLPPHAGQHLTCSCPPTFCCMPTVPRNSATLGDVTTQSDDCSNKKHSLECAQTDRGQIMQFTGTQDYVATEDLTVAVNAAVLLERPY